MASNLSQPFRLPSSVKPLSYRIDVEPNITSGRLNGNVSIKVAFRQKSTVIVVHSLRLDFTHVVYTPESGRAEVLDVAYDTKHQTASMKLPQEQGEDSVGFLDIEYHGQITPAGSMGGLSPVPFRMPDGELKLGFETMMEPTMARAVFPCFDEPAFKASFEINMTVDADPNLTCLSNMDVKSDTITTSPSGDQKRQVNFDTSPIMSTYLVVMVAGYFNVLESNDIHVPVRVWAPVEKNIDNAAYALEITVKSLTTFEKDFHLRFPLPKLDMVGLSGHAGGMEHWGCVTCDEQLIILNDNPSAVEKMLASQLIVHEIAHQWFGNIVTMEFWDAIWLNESFADWASTHALTQIQPDFDWWATFLTSDTTHGIHKGISEAFKLDANRGSHAILDPNIPPSQAFDSIAYLKGCAIIRMLAEDLGLDVFLRGVSSYLKEHAYKNASTGDLWAALRNASGKDVGKTMPIWTTTVGYPVVEVHELGSGSSGSISITQSRFLQTGEQDHAKAIYPLMIQVKTSDGTVKYEMMGRTRTIPVDLSDNYILNPGLAGFYRIQYPLSRIQKLAIRFSDKSLSATDKAGIISDLAAIVATGTPGREARVSDFFDFLFAIKDHESNLFVWREILAQLQNIHAAFLFELDEVHHILQSVRFELLGGLIQQGYLDFGPDDSLEQTLLKTVLYTELKDHPQVLARTRQAWQELLAGNKDALNPNIRRVLFDAVLLLDDPVNTWMTLKSIAYDGTLVEAAESTTRRAALHALGSSSDPQLISRTLECIFPKRRADKALALAPTLTVTRQDRSAMLRSLSRHANGAQMTWDWLRDNWAAFRREYVSESLSGAAILGAALAGLAAEKHLEEVQDFFADKMDQTTKLVIVQAVDNIRARARLAQADIGDLLQWAGNRRLADA